MKKIAMFHTSFVFFENEPLFFEIFREILPEVHVTNIVDDTMSREVIKIGHVTPDLTRRVCHYVLAAAAMDVNAIFNTCSSMGPAFDVARYLVDVPIVKIDDGMSEKVVQEGQKIGVLATAGSTLVPTINLIQEKAALAEKNIETQQALCDGAFLVLMGGEVDRHDDMVAQKAAEVAKWADTLVLAQASMTRLVPRLEEVSGLPVYSSPRLGFERLKQVLE
jgi:Asp/Glu/hydantoin racemase